MSDLSLLRNSLQDALRLRRVAVTALLVALPAVVALLWRTLARADTFDATETYNSMASSMVFGFILTILSVVHGTGTLSREIEGRTIVYLLTRPLPRWRILLVKWLAAWIVVTGTSCLAAALLALTLFGGGFATHLTTDLAILPVGAAAYTALFLLLAATLPRQLLALLFALLFGVGWENLVSLLPGGFARLSVMAHLRTLASHLKEGAEATTADIATDPTTQLMSFDPAIITRFQAWLAMGLTVAVALGFALAIFSLREYSPREEGG